MILRLIVKCLFILVALTSASPIKANYWLVIGTYRQGPSGRPEVSGKIVKILVDDSSPVEFDQPLFLVDPS